MLWGKWTHALWDLISESYLFGAGGEAGLFSYQAVEKLIGFGV